MVRAGVANRGLWRIASKKVGDELLRLQTDYAEAYSRLDKHKCNCEFCRFVSKINRWAQLREHLDRRHG